MNTLSQENMKHLIGNAIYQIIVMYAIVFGGDNGSQNQLRNLKIPTIQDVCSLEDLIIGIRLHYR